MADAGEATDEDKETTKYPCSETDWQSRLRIEEQRVDDVQPRRLVVPHIEVPRMDWCHATSKGARPGREESGEGKEEDRDSAGDRAVMVVC